MAATAALEEQPSFDSATEDRREDEDVTHSERRSDDSFSVEQLRKDLSINDADIDGAMTEQAGLYGYYSSLYAHAQYKADTAENRAKVAKARAYKDVRSRLIAKGAKFSEALLEAEVMLHPDYQNALELTAKYQMKAELCKQALEALRQRRDMLVQKGKSRLEELKGDLFLKGRTSEMDLEEKKRKMRAAMGESSG
jgi:hypothetical protein